MTGEKDKYFEVDQLRADLSVKEANIPFKDGLIKLKHRDLSYAEAIQALDVAKKLQRKKGKEVSIKFQIWDFYKEYMKKAIKGIGSTNFTEQSIVPFLETMDREVGNCIADFLKIDDVMGEVSAEDEKK